MLPGPVPASVFVAGSLVGRGEGTGMAGNTSTAAGSGAIYGLGIFGAWVYYWQEADGFWEHAYAIFEGIFWPAYMVSAAFGALGA